MKINESNYIEELRNKNTKSLDYVIDEYGPLMKGIIVKVLGVLGDEGLVEECMSDALLAIWNNCDKYDDEKGSFRSWIGAITKFKAIDYYRKYSKRQNTQDIIDENLTDGLSAEEVFINGVDGGKLVNIIENLEEPDRTIFTMRFLLGENTKKISEVVRLSIGTINTRVSRGREKIKKAYYKEVGGEAYHG